MFRALLICTLVSASILGCTTTKQPRTAALQPPETCLKTGSRIPRADQDCSGLPGRAYTDEDIRRTGQTNVGDALQLLDPSVSVHH
jgi:hypothetical protein